MIQNIKSKEPLRYFTISEDVDDFIGKLCDRSSLIYLFHQYDLPDFMFKYLGTYLG